MRRELFIVPTATDLADQAVVVRAPTRRRPSRTCLSPSATQTAPRAS